MTSNEQGYRIQMALVSITKETQHSNTRKD